MSVVLWFTGAVISHIASCQYDDLLNVWQCKQSWALPYMQNLDPIIILFAYPVFFIGVLLALIVGLISLFRSILRK